jgi:hypothetical protein
MTDCRNTPSKEGKSVWSGTKERPEKLIRKAANAQAREHVAYDTLLVHGECSLVEASHLVTTERQYAITFPSAVT